MTVFFGWGDDYKTGGYADFVREWREDRWGDTPVPLSDRFPLEGDVLFASYGHGSYCGDALVLFRRGDGLFVNEASHCSCNGLEGQWDPKSIPPEYIKQLAKSITETETDGYGPLSDHEPEARAALVALAATLT